MNIIKAEVYKACKEKWIYFTLISIIIVELITLLIQQKITESQNLALIPAFELMAQLIKNGIFTSLFFILYRSATSISGERSSKSINIILSKSITRWKYLAGKLFTYFFITMFLYFFVFLLAIIISSIYGNFESIAIENYIIISNIELWKNLFLSFTLMLFPTFAIIVVSLSSSIITKQSGLSIALLFVFFLIMYFLDIFGDIINVEFDNKLLMFYLTYPFNNFLDLSSGILNKWSPKIYYLIIGSILYSGIFITFSFFYFKKCDIN